MNDLNIENLLLNLERFTAFPRPRGYGSAKFHNSFLNELMDSIEILSSKKRLDIISVIFEKIGDSKNPKIAYNILFSILIRNLNGSQILDLYKLNPKLFSKWFTSGDIKEIKLTSLKSKFDDTSNINVRQFFEFIETYFGHLEELN